MRSFTVARPASVLATLFFCAVLAACDNEPVREYHGILYFGAGGYLGQFNLADGSSSVVVGVGDANIREVHEMQRNRVLLVLDVFESTRQVTKISWLDTKTYQVTALFQGTKVAWLPEYETYLYDDGSRLSAVTHSEEQDTDNIILDHRLNAVTTIHIVSESHAIFDAGPRDAPTIHQYDVVTRQVWDLERLAELCHLRGSAWISARNKLACRSRADSGRFLLSDIDGLDVESLPLPEGRQFSLVKEITGQNALVVSELEKASIGGKRGLPVFAMDLDTGELTEISGDQHLGDAVALAIN